MKTVSWICRLGLGGVFIYAAIIKLVDPADFVGDIDHYALLPYSLALAFGVFLPWLELVGGIAVILRWQERGALLLLLSLCGIFGFALASAWWRGLDINCGCFGHHLAVFPRGAWRSPATWGWASSLFSS